MLIFDIQLFSGNRALGWIVVGGGGLKGNFVTLRSVAKCKEDKKEGKNERFPAQDLQEVKYLFLCTESTFEFLLIG